MFPASLLETDLDDALGRAYRGDDRFALFQRMSDGLFAISILARLQRIRQHPHVPMVGRGDDHGIHVLAVEQRAMVAVFLGVRGMRGFGGDQMRFVNVAERHDVIRFELIERAQKSLAALSGPDGTDANAVIGSENPAV